MSGQLVGEVFDAIESGILTLTQAEKLCLVAIAERCHVDTRQGSVRKSRIQAAIGQSERTTERVIGALKERGLIRIVKRGFKAHGISRAPIYELPPFRVAEPEGSEEFPPHPRDGSPPSMVADADESNELPPLPADELPPFWVAEADGPPSSRDGAPPSRVAKTEGRGSISNLSGKGFGKVELPSNPDELPPNPPELPPNQGWASATDPSLTCGPEAYDGSNYDGSCDGFSNDGPALRAAPSVSASQAPHLPMDVTWVCTTRTRDDQKRKLREIYPDQFEGQP